MIQDPVKAVQDPVAQTKPQVVQGPQPKQAAWDRILDGDGSGSAADDQRQQFFDALLADQGYAMSEEAQGWDYAKNLATGTAKAAADGLAHLGTLAFKAGGYVADQVGAMTGGPRFNTADILKSAVGTESPGAMDYLGAIAGVTEVQVYDPASDSYRPTTVGHAADDLLARRLGRGKIASDTMGLLLSFATGPGAAVGKGAAEAVRPLSMAVERAVSKTVLKNAARKELIDVESLPRLMEGGKGLEILAAMPEWKRTTGLYERMLALGGRNVNDMMGMAAANMAQSYGLLNDEDRMRGAVMGVVTAPLVMPMVRFGEKIASKFLSGTLSQNEMQAVKSVYDRAALHGLPMAAIVKDLNAAVPRIKNFGADMIAGSFEGTAFMSLEPENWKKAWAFMGGDSEAGADLFAAMMGSMAGSVVIKGAVPNDLGHMFRHVRPDLNTINTWISAEAAKRTIEELKANPPQEPVKKGGLVTDPKKAVALEGQFGSTLERSLSNKPRPLNADDLAKKNQEVGNQLLDKKASARRQVEQDDLTMGAGDEPPTEAPSFSEDVSRTYDRVEQGLIGDYGWSHHEALGLMRALHREPEGLDDGGVRFTFGPEFSLDMRTDNGVTTLETTSEFLPLLKEAGRELKDYEVMSPGRIRVKGDAARKLTDDLTFLSMFRTMYGDLTYSRLGMQEVPGKPGHWQDSQGGEHYYVMQPDGSSGRQRKLGGWEGSEDIVTVDGFDNPKYPPSPALEALIPVIVQKQALAPDPLVDQIITHAILMAQHSDSTGAHALRDFFVQTDPQQLVAMLNPQSDQVLAFQLGSLGVGNNNAFYAARELPHMLGAAEAEMASARAKAMEVPDRDAYMADVLDGSDEAAVSSEGGSPKAESSLKPKSRFLPDPEKFYRGFQTPEEASGKTRHMDKGRIWDDPFVIEMSGGQKAYNVGANDTFRGKVDPDKVERIFYDVDSYANYPTEYVAELREMFPNAEVFDVKLPDHGDGLVIVGPSRVAKAKPKPQAEEDPHSGYRDAMESTVPEDRTSSLADLAQQIDDARRIDPAARATVSVDSNLAAVLREILPRKSRATKALEAAKGATPSKVVLELNAKELSDAARKFAADPEGITQQFALTDKDAGTAVQRITAYLRNAFESLRQNPRLADLISPKNPEAGFDIGVSGLGAEMVNVAKRWGQAAAKAGRAVGDFFWERQAETLRGKGDDSFADDMRAGQAIRGANVGHAQGKIRPALKAERKAGFKAQNEVVDTDAGEKPRWQALAEGRVEPANAKEAAVGERAREFLLEEWRQLKKGGGLRDFLDPETGEVKKKPMDDRPSKPVFPRILGKDAEALGETAFRHRLWDKVIEKNELRVLGEDGESRPMTPTEFDARWSQKEGSEVKVPGKLAAAEFTRELKWFPSVFEGKHVLETNMGEMMRRVAQQQSGRAASLEVFGPDVTDAQRQQLRDDFDYEVGDKPGGQTRLNEFIQKVHNPGDPKRSKETETTARDLLTMLEGGNPKQMSPLAQAIYNIDSIPRSTMTALSFLLDPGDMIAKGIMFGGLRQTVKAFAAVARNPQEAIIMAEMAGTVAMGIGSRDAYSAPTWWQKHVDAVGFVGNKTEAFKTAFFTEMANAMMARWRSGKVVGRDRWLLAEMVKFSPEQQAALLAGKADTATQAIFRREFTQLSTARRLLDEGSRFSASPNIRAMMRFTNWASGNLFTVARLYKSVGKDLVSGDAKAKVVAVGRGLKATGLLTASGLAGQLLAQTVAGLIKGEGMNGPQRWWNELATYPIETMRRAFIGQVLGGPAAMVTNAFRDPNEVRNWANMTTLGSWGYVLQRAYHSIDAMTFTEVGKAIGQAAVEGGFVPLGRQIQSHVMASGAMAGADPESRSDANMTWAWKRAAGIESPQFERTKPDEFYEALGRVRTAISAHPGDPKAQLKAASADLKEALGLADERSVASALRSYQHTDGVPIEKLPEWSEFMGEDRAKRAYAHDMAIRKFAEYVGYLHGEEPLPFAQEMEVVESQARLGNGTHWDNMVDRVTSDAAVQIDAKAPMGSELRMLAESMAAFPEQLDWLTDRQKKALMRTSMSYSSRTQMLERILRQRARSRSKSGKERLRRLRRDEGIDLAEFREEQEQG